MYAFKMNIKYNTIDNTTWSFPILDGQISVTLMIYNEY